MSPLEQKNHKTINQCIQPTVSGIIDSGKFGLVREHSTKFHEGIDIRSFLKDKKGNPNDNVYAFLPGKVVYINTSPSSSSYGRYVVIEHEHFLTLYAHLASVSVKVGDQVGLGKVLGVLGTSSNCTTIPKSRAHVHFEVDFRLGDQDHFSQWYSNNYKDKNHHGMYNGLNLVGVDPLSAIAFGQKNNTWNNLFREEKEAAVVQIMTTQVPEFVRHYKVLFAPYCDLSKPVKGWKIKFTWYGLPFAWEPIYSEAQKSNSKKIIEAKLPKTNTVVRLISYRKSLQKSAVLRNVLSENKSTIGIGTRIISNLSKIGL